MVAGVRDSLAAMHSRSSSFTAIALMSILAFAACEKKGSKAPGNADTSVPPATFATSVEAPKVVAECDLQNKLPLWLAEFAPSTAPGAGGSTGKVLAMEITHVMGFGGGLYSGPKQIVVKGTLSEGGQVKGSFEAKRTTVTGGAFGGYKGTCSLLHRTAKAVAKDVSEWLPSPTMDAKLGEL